MIYYILYSIVRRDCGKRISNSIRTTNMTHQEIINMCQSTKIFNMLTIYFSIMKPHRGELITGFSKLYHIEN